MSHRFDYEHRGEDFHVFDRLGEAGSDRSLATCTEVWVAELLVAALRKAKEYNPVWHEGRKLGQSQPDLGTLGTPFPGWIGQPLKT